MLNGLRAKIRRWLISDVFKGITEEDCLDVSALDADERSSYCRAARRVWTSKAFVAELNRLRFAQERKMVSETKTTEDMEFGRAVLYTLDLVTKRFQSLASMANAEDGRLGRTDEGY